MSNYFIPQAWSVGIKSVDTEHQNLLDLLHIFEHEVVRSAETDTECFEEFYKRLSILMKTKEQHMEENNYFYIETSKNHNDKSLQHLMYVHAVEAENIFIACRAALLEEIANAELYYNSPPVSLAKTG